MVKIQSLVLTANIFLFFLFPHMKHCNIYINKHLVGVGFVVSVSAFHALGRRFTPRLGDTQDHKNGRTASLLDTHVLR